MIKGFIFFRKGKIPFVIENYRMELFTDDELLTDFTKEYNFKEDYILEGEYYANDFQGQKSTFLVERSMGSVCYLRCYMINRLTVQDGYDTIGFQSFFLDDIFRYKYNYIDMVRAGINLAVEPKDIYKIPFSMDNSQYELSFRIGNDNRLGLLEDFDKKGEVLILLYTNNIQECYNISIILYRLAMFLTSEAEVPFRQITLYKNREKVGWLYCSLVSEDAISVHDISYCEFDVLKYIPKILNNIALDSGNKITTSIPLGHLGNSDTLFSPQRFMEQVMAFEYLFDKLEHQKAKNSRFSLKEELIYSFNLFPELLKNGRLSVEDISDKIKEIRRTIAHGYMYYYDFKNNIEARRLMLLLDRLIRNMSLFWIGFSKEDISDYGII